MTTHHRFRSARARTAPVHLEPLEARCLLSATIAQIYTPHFTLNSFGGAIDDVKYADLAGLLDASSNYIDTPHAEITWDNGVTEAVNFWKNPDGTVALYDAGFEGETPGTHTASIHFWTTSGNSTVDDLTFSVSVVVDWNSPGGTTIQGSSGQSFTGYVGTLKNLKSAGDPVNTTDPTITKLIITIAWGDGTTSAGTLVANSAGGYDVFGTHTYAADGTYRILVQALDIPAYNPNYISQSPGELFALPDYILLADSLKSTAIIGNSEGTQVSDSHTLDTTLASVPYYGKALPSGFVLPPGLTSASANYVNVDWGDGTSSTATLVANNEGGFDILGQHTYADDGAYIAHITGSATKFASAIDASDFTGINLLDLNLMVQVNSDGIFMQNVFPLTITLPPSSVIRLPPIRVSPPLPHLPTTIIISPSPCDPATMPMPADYGPAGLINPHKKKPPAHPTILMASAPQWLTRILLG